ncbi:hypothetical protein [Luteimonas abyssi]|uniref:hypothetical protein n=1 Tax=Luteimonas abyssi TaxID=1247514 RepID=UPI000B1B1205|nr:hypothetical protein [Luteimonas abyssi]
MPAFAVGDRVYVPCLLVPELENQDTALYKTKISSVNANSATVELPGGAVSKAIGVSRLHSDVGILIINIGDFVSESALLDPLSKSVLQFCRLLVPDDQVAAVKVRSVAELKAYWSKNHKAYTHIILVGHGDKDGLGFGVDGDVDLPALDDTFKDRGAKSKSFISLCCKTGRADFGKKFSQFTICKSLAAPFHSVHGATASQFCQTMLTWMLLEGRTTKVAFKSARESVTGAVSFRLWQNGTLSAGS